MNAPARVYLVVNRASGFLKWGKANNTKFAKRLREHARQGFSEVAGMWPFSTGRQASTVERAVGAAIRVVGAVTRADQQLMPYKGYTETASLTEIDLDSAVGIIDRLARSA